MEVILQQILNQLKEIKDGQSRMEKKLEVVYEHTAKITEDITLADMKLDKISDDVDFIKLKEHQTEEDLFKLKKNLQIIK